MPRIETPVERMAVQTPKEYRRRQKAILDQNQQARPFREWPKPFEAPEKGVLAYIDAGVWRVNCACHEAPITHPDWQLACCAGCGAIYTEIQFPENSAAIEIVLLARPRQYQRNWLPGVTVDQLIADNIANGVPVPELDAVG